MDKSEILENLKQVLLYICLFILFRTVFVLVTPYYMHVSPEMNGPIDARVMDYHFFDDDYVQSAKNRGYIPEQYYKVYFPLDLVFPVIYTLMFLAAIEIYKNKKFYNVLRAVVFAGMILDYLENFSFAIYLGSSGLAISSLVAFFTTIKSLVFLANGVVFIFSLIYALVVIVQPFKRNNRA